MPRQSMTYQFDLFSGLHGGKIAATPQWQELPEECVSAWNIDPSGGVIGVQF